MLCLRNSLVSNFVVSEFVSLLILPLFSSAHHSSPVTLPTRILWMDEDVKRLAVCVGLDQARKKYQCTLLGTFMYEILFLCAKAALYVLMYSLPYGSATMDAAY